MANTNYTNHEHQEAMAAAAEKRVKNADNHIARLRREIEQMTREIAKFERYKAEDAALAARLRKDATRNRKADAVLNATLLATL